MALNPESLKAVCFDLGNTLIEFEAPQMARQYAHLQQTLESLLGPCDGALLKLLRDRQIMMPYRNNYHENDLWSCGAELIREIYEIEPEDHHVAAMVEARYQSFVSQVEVAEEVRQLLIRLAGRYRLALLSNYPCGRSIRDGLQRLEIAEHFEAIVISGEVGRIKPHRRPFEVLLEELDLEASECVYVGDNWLADIQGAKAMGMAAIFTTQHQPYETFEHQEGDHEPDARIQHLSELHDQLLPPKRPD